MELSTLAPESNVHLIIVLREKNAYRRQCSSQWYCHLSILMMSLFSSQGGEEIPIFGQIYSKL